MVEFQPVLACAFDLGNTLSNDSALNEVSIGEMASFLVKNGFLSSPADFVGVYRESQEQKMPPFTSRTFGEREFFQETFGKLGIHGITAEAGLARFREIVTRHMDYAGETREALVMVRSRGYKLALISNERTVRVDAFLDKTQSRELFDAILVSEAVGIEKPDLEIFRLACDRLGVDPGGLLMFGDNDIADGACKRLGSRYARVAAFHNTRWYWESGSSYEPDHVVSRVAPGPVGELLDSLEAMTSSR